MSSRSFLDATNEEELGLTAQQEMDAEVLRRSKWDISMYVEGRILFPELRTKVITLNDAQSAACHKSCSLS